jgi:hypothetical protein
VSLVYFLSPPNARSPRLRTGEVLRELEQVLRVERPVVVAALEVHLAAPREVRRAIGEHALEVALHVRVLDVEAMRSAVEHEPVVHERLREPADLRLALHDDDRHARLEQQMRADQASDPRADHDDRPSRSVGTAPSSSAEL